MNKHHIIQLSVYLLIIIAAIAVWILPTYALVQNQKLKIYDERVKIEQQTQQFSDTKSLTQQYNKIGEDVKTLQAAFLSKETDTILNFIDQIDTTASALHVTDSVTISPLPNSTTNVLTKSDVAITASGSYPAVMTFLTKIETKSIYMNFNSVEISTKEETSANSFSLTLKGSIYWK